MQTTLALVSCITVYIYTSMCRHDQILILSYNTYIPMNDFIFVVLLDYFFLSSAIILGSALLYRHNIPQWMPCISLACVAPPPITRPSQCSIFLYYPCVWLFGSVWVRQRWSHCKFMLMSYLYNLITCITKNLSCSM